MAAEHRAPAGAAAPEGMETPEACAAALWSMYIDEMAAAIRRRDEAHAAREAAAVRVQATETQRQRERAEQAERERERWEDCAHSAGAAVMEANEIEAAAVARATAAEGQAQALRELLAWVQGCVVRAAHGLTLALKGNGLDGADLRETAIGVASGLMDVDAAITKGATPAPPPAQADADALRAEVARLRLALDRVHDRAAYEVSEAKARASLAESRAAFGRSGPCSPAVEVSSETFDALAALAGKPEVAKAGTVACACGEAVEPASGWAAQGYFDDMPDGRIKRHRLPPESCTVEDTATAPTAPAKADPYEGETNCGGRGPLDRLTPEELAKVPPIDQAKIDAALAQGERDAEAIRGANVIQRDDPTRFRAAPAKAEVPPALEWLAGFSEPEHMASFDCDGWQIMAHATARPHGIPLLHCISVHAETVAAAKAKAERIARAAGLLPPPAASKEEHSE